MLALDSLVGEVGELTFAQLRAFVVAARVGSFAKTADLLSVSQPTISEQIKTLEQRLGYALFNRRSGTTPVLTPQGEEAFGIVEAILSASQDLFTEIQPAIDKTSLRLSVGTYLKDQFVRPLLPRIYQQFPDIQVDLHPAVSTPDAMRMIENGTLHLAILAIPADTTPPPNTRIVCDIPMVMVAPPGTGARLAAGECTLSDFQQLFSVHRDLGGDMARRVLRRLGMKPRTPHLFIEFVDALIQMVENGQGIGHLMRYAVEDRIAAGTLEVLDVQLAPISRVIARSPHAPAEAGVIEDILNEILPT